MVFFALVKRPFVHFCGVDHIRSAALLMSLIFFIASREARAEWFADSELGAVYDDNLTRAVDTEDRKADLATLAKIHWVHWGYIGDVVSN